MIVKSIEKRYTDDGCYLYLFTCCKYEQESRTSPAFFCPNCGKRIEEKQKGKDKKYFYNSNPSKIKSWWMRKRFVCRGYKGEFIEHHLGSRAMALLCMKITRKYGIWNWHWDSMEDAEEGVKEQRMLGLYDMDSYYEFEFFLK